MSNFGFPLLIAIISLSLLGSCACYFFLKKNTLPKEELTGLVQKFSVSLLVLAILSQLCLIYSFIVSDYSVLNVYQNSHHLKPLIYKISGSWGNHEGSMLLLITILCFYLTAFSLFSRASNEQKVLTFCIQSFVIFLFGIYTALVSNPFEKNFYQVSEGLGLNPVLQDIGLAIHPPMLYLGYIGVSIIFSYCLAGLLTEKINKDFAKHLKVWALIAFAFLTAGIGLGSWWAYRELGWGGYWFWDPVENVSLMPWIAVLTLLHSIKALEKKGVFKVWTANLAILSFLMSLLGIFLVRSGVLTSVHSFAVDAQRGFFVIALLLIIGSLGFLILAKKMPTLLSDTKSKINFKSQVGLILANNYFLVIAIFVVMLGTLYPIFSRGMFGKFISIGPDYYNKIFSILIIPFLAFLSLNFYLFDKNKRKLVISTVIALILGLLLVLSIDKSDIFLALIAFLAFFSAIYSVLCIKKQSLLMSLGHLGFALIICGIVLSSTLSDEKQLNMKINETVTLGSYNIKFSDILLEKNANYVSRVGEFSVRKNNQEITKLYPKLNYYPTSDQTTNEAAIKHLFSGDLYLVIGQKDENENYAIRGYFKSFIWLIWLGSSLIFGGCMIFGLNFLFRK